MPARLLRRLVALPLAALHFYCVAAAPAPLLSDYTHSAWGALQGAPVDVLKFAQTQDGWLWIATPTGLFRYDGVHFERVDSVHGQRLASNNVMGLAATADGALWVGYRLGGVSVFRKNGSYTYTAADGLPSGTVYHIEAAPDGAIWVGTRDGAAWLASGAKRFELQGANVNLPARAYQILFGRDRTAWVVTSHGIFFRKPGQTHFAPAWPRTFLAGMEEAPDGTIWGGDLRGNYYRVRSTEPTANDVPRPVEKASGMHFDGDGTMWLLQVDGVERKLAPTGPSVPAQRLTRHNGLSGTLPQSSFQDREGNIWIGTSAGLDRLRPNRLKTLSVAQPLDHPVMVPGPSGDVWIGDYAGDVRSFTADGVKKVELPGDVAASHRAPDGTLWLANDRSLRRRGADGSMTRVAPPQGRRDMVPQAMQQDRSGALWVSFVSGELFRLERGRWTEETDQSGSPSELTTAMAMDGQGAVWMGHAGNLVSVVSEGPHGRVVRRLGTAEGLQLGTVLQLYSDGDLMWAGGEGGIALYRSGRFAALRGEHGDVFRGISGIARLPGGDLWLHGADAIYHVTAASLAAWMNDTTKTVDFERFDAQDGLQGNASQLRPLPSLILGPDGQLWFSTASAIATLDPAHIRRNRLAPPVQIPALVSGGVRYSTDGATALRLPQGSKSLELAFTALSLSMPERVRFRYRLIGVDDSWQEPIGRRVAFYTNLAPGNYRFEVVAANEDNVWNQQGAALDIIVPPTFVQTPWFVLLLAVVAALLLHGGYVLRIRHLTQRMQERLQERLAERSRIARSLHDTLLQSVQALIMSFHAHTHLLPKGTRERAQLDGTLNLADQLLVEGRDQIMDLRASASPDELGLALQQFGKGLSEHRAHIFEARISAKCRKLQPRVHDEIYAIAREALFNASRYAEAGLIVLELDYAPNAFTLRVRDNGCGLDESVKEAGHRPGHWGLIGMRERVSIIGASLRIDSQPGIGTEVEVLVPGKLAY